MSQAILWYLNFSKHLGTLHSCDSCLKDSLLKQDNIQRQRGSLERGIAENPHLMKKKIHLLFLSILINLSFSHILWCIVFSSLPEHEVLKCSRIREFARVGLRRTTFLSLELCNYHHSFLWGKVLADLYTLGPSPTEDTVSEQRRVYMLWFLLTLEVGF